MSKDEFVQGYLERLIEKDPEIRSHFNRGEEREKQLLREILQYSLEKSYDTYAKEYFDSKGVGSYVSTFLRTTGAVADAVGTYMFWLLGGAGFGFKGAGLLEKSIADVIDASHYAKHAKTDSVTEKVLDEGKALGEGAAERALAYLPLGVGEAADLLRGRSKYDKKVTARALSHAKENFLDYMKRPEEKELKVMPLERFKHPDYAPLEERFSMAA